MCVASIVKGLKLHHRLSSYLKDKQPYVFKHNDCNIYLLQLISIWPIIHLCTNNPLIVRIDFQSITVNATTYKYFHRASISFADCHILYSPITAMTLSLCDLLFRRLVRHTCMTMPPKYNILCRKTSS